MKLRQQVNISRTSLKKEYIQKNRILSEFKRRKTRARVNYGLFGG